MSSSDSENTVVILGAGIIGLSTAYYISQDSPTTQIHLVDTSPTLFTSASGKAAGFLARDWFSPTISSLGALSFDLHKKLANEHDGGKEWGYSPSTALSISDLHTIATKGRGEDWLLEGTTRALAASGNSEGNGESKIPTWLAVGRGKTQANVQPISDGSTTAQVDPLLLCQFLLKQCLSRNVKVHHPATPTGIVTSSDNILTGLTIRSPSDSESTTTLPCSHLLLTAGVWTPTLFNTLFPNSSTKIPITHLSGHSLILRSPRWTADSYSLLSQPSSSTSGSKAQDIPGCHAAFASDSSLDWSPEIFSRAGGDIYLAGLNTTSISVPSLATDVTPVDSDISILLKVAQKLLGDDAEGLEVLKTGFCHRPVTPRGVPLLTELGEEVTGLNGRGKVWVCAGHGPWGISLSLGTGLVLAESVLGRTPSADVSRLGL